MSGDGFTILAADDCEPSGNWLLVRRSLGLEAFGMNVVDIAPGERIPEHDETGRDQEEVFLVLSGDGAAIVIEDEAHDLPPGAFARLDPSLKRTVANNGSEPVRLLIASAPRSSGYEPMGWA
jgi:quercetin dioxygenase-like cupin family protein